MLNDTAARPGIEERYETACNASSLVVEERTAGAADVLIAAGWSDSRIGMALLRLHSEWDGAAKPKRATETMIQALAARFRADDRKGGTPQGSPQTRARTEAQAWYRRELRLLAQSLKTRAPVIEQLTAWAVIKGIDPAVVGPSVHHWLAPRCSVCDGLGRRKVPDAPALSGKVCHACNGTGNAHPPQGSGRVLAFIDYAVQVGRNSMKRRLRGAR